MKKKCLFVKPYLENKKSFLYEIMMQLYYKQSDTGIVNIKWI